MPETGETHVFIFAEVCLDFLTLGGGFHDEEGAGRCAGTISDGGGGGGASSDGSGGRRLDFKLGWHYSCVYCK